MSAMHDPAPRAVVHIGTPKSGTTFLQRGLWKQRAPLEAAGVHLPGARERDVFLAAIEVREAFRFWGRDPQQLAGSWQRLCNEARARGGTTILSHEILAGATEEQVRRALNPLEGFEIHVLVTVRDLARQLVSTWQEDVKNGRSTSFEDYQSDVIGRMQRGELRGTFWRLQDVAGILARWGVAAPPERVHVVVAPPAGSPSSLLWERFADAVGFDPGQIGVPDLGAGANPTLGTQQVAALRRVNRALDGRIQHPQYGRVVKRQFAQQLLGEQVGTRPECPQRTVDELTGFASATIATLRQRGYRVHGDLAELTPVRRDERAPHPDDVSPDAELDSLAAATAELLVQQAQVRRGGRRAAPQRPAETGRLRRLLTRARRVVPS